MLERPSIPTAYARSHRPHGIGRGNRKRRIPYRGWLG